MVSCQTITSLINVRKLAARDRSDELVVLKIHTEQFLSRKEIRNVGLSAASNIYYWKAASEFDEEFRPSDVGWSAWRLGVEYAALYFRTNAETDHMYISTSVDVSIYLKLAYALWFLGQQENATKVAQICANTLPNIIDRVLRPGYPSEVLGAIGFFLEHVGGENTRHHAFEFDAKQLLTEGGLNKAAFARRWYSDPAYEGGTILHGWDGDLIPLELVYLNIHLPKAERDADLVEMARHMAATEYPNDTLFIGLDTTLTVAGY